MKNDQDGQALVMVILSIGVVITIALSVVSRSVTDISTSTKDEESLRAFSAAEAGVEEVLKNPVAELPVTQTQTSTQIGTANTTYSSTTNSFPANRREYLYPVELTSGDSATIWLSTHDTSGNLTCSGSSICYTANSFDLCWGKTGASTQPAVALSVMYEDPNAGSQLKYAFATYDPNSSRTSSNKFASNGITTNSGSGACTVEGVSLANRATVNLSSLGIPNNAISGKRLKGVTALILYNQEPTLLGVNNLPADLPDQGRRIESTGVSGTASRKVQVYSLYPEVPSMFQAAIYSPPGITQ